MSVVATLIFCIVIILTLLKALIIRIFEFVIITIIKYLKYQIPDID